MKSWLSLLSSPIGMVDFGLLLFVILRITHERVQEQRNPHIGRCLAGFCGIGITVSTISFGVAYLAIILALILIGVLRHARGFGLAIVLAVAGLQLLMPVGILVGYLIGNPMSRMFWPKPVADSDEIQN